MSKKILSLVSIIILILYSNANAGVFFDDFNDGDANGWVFPYNSAMSQGPGIWSVENGILVESFFGDNNAGLVDNLLISDQVIEVQASSQGYAGVVLWYQQVDNTLANYVAVTQNYFGRGLSVMEVADGQYNIYQAYPSGSVRIGTAFDMRVEADSATGELAVYVNSRVHPDVADAFTYTVNTTNRTGLSGLYAGNYYGYFDNFRLTSDDISAIPEPATMFLLGFGLIGTTYLKRRKK